VRLTYSGIIDEARPMGERAAGESAARAAGLRREGHMATSDRVRAVLVAALAVAAGLLLLADDVRAQSAAPEYSAQSRRPPTRLRVQPPYYPYRNYSTDYPVPYDYEFPGPNAVRQCKARLVQEMRPSGPTVVPKMHCWWERR
jgi:hypothetical protein